MAMKVTYLTIDREIVSETRGGVVSDYIPDTIGSTAKLVNTSMEVTDVYSYWPYGEIRTHTGSSVTPFSFVGTRGYYSDRWGGCFVRAREFQPAKTQWISRDRMWPRFVAFVYARCSPTTSIDPTGNSAGSDLVNCIADGVSQGYSAQGACGWCQARNGYTGGFSCSTLPNNGNPVAPYKPGAPGSPGGNGGSSDGGMEKAQEGPSAPDFYCKSPTGLAEEGAQEAAGGLAEAEGPSTILGVGGTLLDGTMALGKGLIPIIYWRERIKQAYRGLDGD